jgi:hypothetical protein
MSGAIIAIIKEKLSLCIFCEGRRKDINNKNTNTDKGLILTMVNQVVSYQNLQQLRNSYSIDAQDPYFFVKEKLFPGIIIYQKTGY